MLTKLVVIVAGMFAFGYALVPLYRAICEATGINILALSERVGTSGAGKVNTQVDSSRTITVEFDANARGPWEFKPECAKPCHVGSGHSQLCASTGGPSFQ